MTPFREGTPSSSQDVMRTHGRSFHFASHFLKDRHAERAARLYAFCRYLDDTVDLAESKSEAERTLDHIARELAGQAPATAATRDFLALMDEVGLAPSMPVGLISGLRSDLGVVAVKTEAELIRYAYHVAGIVGLMMCDVVDVKAPEARPFAIDLGIAMQLTNIARDVDEDARRGHRYLPEAWVGPVTPQQIVDPDPEMKHILRQASRRLLDRAEIYYRSADRGLGHLPARARFAILVAGRVYRQIGVSIARQDHASWQGRARVSRPVKLQVAAGAALSFLGCPHLHARDALHDQTLHEALAGLPGTHPAGP